MNKTIFILFSIIIFLSVSCGEDEIPTKTFPEFERQEMLENWADNIIIPAFEAYVLSLEELVNRKDDFINEADEGSFENLRTAYLNAYKAWQKVAMFDIGKAEEIGLRNFTNIYPTDTEAINNNIVNDNYNLELPSNFDTQGFPALDYLLYGIDDDDNTIIDFLSSENYTKYLDDLVTRLHALATEVSQDWLNGYRTTFINNDGSSATASVDKLVNDFLFYYEKFLRAGKVGIPAGIFSGNPIPTAVEAPYSKVHSKALFLEALESVQDFFKGTSYDGATEGISLRANIDYIQSQNIIEVTSTEILGRLDLVATKAAELSDNFGEQIVNDNNKMLEIYDELQTIVILLKVDMMQALNIQVDYVDADGD